MRLERGDAPSTEEANPEAEQWSRTEHLLAAVRDELNALRYAFVASKSKQRPKWKPEPTPRPGVKPKKKRPRLTETQKNALALYLEQFQGEPDN